MYMSEVRKLTVGLKKNDKVLKAVNGVNLSVQEGQIVGLVGESGCGKSTALFSIMGLVPGNGRILSGDIALDGENITAYSKERWRKLRGKDVAMIFQDPMTALNPAYSVGEQIREVLKVHKLFRNKKIGRASCRERVQNTVKRTWTKAQT